MNFTRYALYYAPPSEHPLASFAKAWFGWDPETASDIPLITQAGLTPEMQRDVVQTPKRYGFHGTLKPPFHLADGCSIDELEAQLGNATSSLAAVNMGAFALKKLGGFLALAPVDPPPALQVLAETLVRELDGFRKAPSAEELAKRRAKELTPRQDELLDRWGYPYVFDEFRFHLTLTGSLEQDRLESVAGVLEPALAEAIAKPLTITDVALFGDPGGGARFQMVKRFPLSKVQ